MKLALPEPVGRGKVKPERRARYEAEIEAWCEALLELKPRIEHNLGVREWCYVLEPYGLAKGDFDRAEKLINTCRKSGLLPLDFTTDDTEKKWEFSNVEEIEDAPEDKAAQIAAYVKDAETYYDPVSFWEFQDNYVEMLVEKSSLKKLFDPECVEYIVPCGIAGGSWSINMRVDLLKRLAEKQKDGKDCKLLYCGDHDPHGLRISRVLRANLAAVLPSFKRTYPEFEDLDLDEVEIDRFGLNADFINANGLTWIDGLETASGKDLGDPGHPKNGDHDVQDYIARFGKKKVEAEALVIRPQEGRDLCRQAILKYIDLYGIKAFERVRDDKRAEMRAHLDRLLAEVQ
jgi:hypothetical protein